MTSRLKRAGIALARTAFGLSMCLLLCIVLWETVVAQHIYHCSDPGFLEFLSPGNWYHAQYDTLKAGWTQTGLWILWSAMLTGSVIASIGATVVLYKMKNISTPAP